MAGWPHVRARLVRRHSPPRTAARRRWFPPLGYARAVTLVLAYGGSTVSAGTELASALVTVFFVGTAAGFLGIYLYHVIPSEDSGGQAASPLFPIHAIARLFGVSLGAASPAAAAAAAERAPLLQDDLDMCAAVVRARVRAR